MKTNIFFQIKTAWARFGILSNLISKAIKYRGKPILILSMPRSGSSWVGRVFAESPYVIYLREPVTQSILKYGITPSEFLLRKGCNPPKVIRKYFDIAFLGMPAFPKKIAGRANSDWTLMSRPMQSLVIKEVNPFLCHYYVDRFNPKIIFLLRHPAGIASSYKKMGWALKMKHFWFNNTVTQARATCAAMSDMKHTCEHTFVKFEDLCEKPIKVFKDLFEFSDIKWTHEVESFLYETMESSQNKDPYSIVRETKKMPYLWKNEITEEQLGQIKRAYLEYDLPWYDSESDWRLD